MHLLILFLVIKQRKSKYTNEYFVDKIIDCIENFCSWSKYGNILNKYTPLPKFHHKYLNEIYVKLSRLHIFEIISNAYSKEQIGLNP